MYIYRERHREITYRQLLYRLKLCLALFFFVILLPASQVSVVVKTFIAREGVCGGCERTYGYLVPSLGQSGNKNCSEVQER